MNECAPQHEVHVESLQQSRNTLSFSPARQVVPELENTMWSVLQPISTFLMYYSFASDCSTMRHSTPLRVRAFQPWKLSTYMYEYILPCIHVHVYTCLYMCLSRVFFHLQVWDLHVPIHVHTYSTHMYHVNVHDCIIIYTLCLLCVCGRVGYICTYV